MKEKKQKGSKIAKPKEKRVGNFFYDFVKITGSIPMLLWFRPKSYYISGKKTKQKNGVLVACNHTGFSDPIKCLIHFWYRRVNSLASADLYNNKFKSWLFNHFLCIKVDKHNFNMSTFYEVSKRLSQDKMVLIFPEGGINNKSDKVMTFKSGAILMALKTKKPVLPIYVSKREKWWQRCRIIVGEPIDVSSMTQKPMPSLEELDKISNYVHEKEVELENFYFSLMEKRKNKKAKKTKIDKQGAN